MQAQRSRGSDARRYNSRCWPAAEGSDKSVPSPSSMHRYVTRMCVAASLSSAFSTYWTFSPTVRIRVGLSHSCLDRGRRPIVILRPGQVGSFLSPRGGARSPNDEISPRGRVWNRELIENRWINLSRWVGPGMRRENLIARTARRERNRYPLLESHTIRNLRLCPFGSLAKNPLANIGCAVNQRDAPVLALTQESHNLDAH
jgi:hypothetical protein